MRHGWTFGFFAFATTLGYVAAPSTAATATFLGGVGGWHSGASWSTGTVPTLADDVVIPTGFALTLTGSGGNYVANTLTIQGTSTITLSGANPLTFTVDGGGNNPSSINATNGFRISNPNADLQITGTQTWSGAGSMYLEAVDEIIISSGVTWTVAFSKIYGEGDIVGSGTLKLDNGADLTAGEPSPPEPTGALSLASTISLDDTSTSNVWSAEGGYSLVFNNAATGLVGKVEVRTDASLVFNDDVTTTGSFELDCGTIDIGPGGATFTYGTFDAGSACPNPGSGGGPYSVSADVANCCD